MACVCKDCGEPVDCGERYCHRCEAEWERIDEEWKEAHDEG